MKPIITICMLLIFTIAAQAQKKTFVRIFDEQGNKTYKGFLENTSDNSVIISTNKESREIPADQIGKIKLRRSFGHTVLVSTLVSAASLAILGAATADPSAWIFGYTAVEGIITGIIVGVISGVPIGSIIAVTRNRSEFIIDGNQDQWKKVREKLKVFCPVPENKNIALIPGQTGN